MKLIADYCKEHPELGEKVTIVLKKQDEILTNKGGNAPNMNDYIITYPNDKCVLPFKQLIIRPDKKASLCCQDSLGKNTLADLTKETIVEARYNDRFITVRRWLTRGGRKDWGYCKICAVLSNRG